MASPLPLSLLLLLFTFFSLPLLSLSQSIPNLNSEKQTLLRVKQEWGNQSALSTWSNSSSISYCNWTGIQCDSNGFVTNISLPRLNISGGVPPSICQLQSLSVLNLNDNYLGGAFPTILYDCNNLHYLDLSNNTFIGELPADINHLSSNLTYLSLSENNFTGQIPVNITKVTALQSLQLDNNLFTGSYPVEIGNLTNLQMLTLAYNNFNPSQIPDEFGKLKSLTYIFMAGANLVGEIPESLSQLKGLYQFDFSVNNLTGSIPPWIWSLKNLEYLYLWGNKFTGEITLANGTFAAKSIRGLDLTKNQISGPIPDNFGYLQNLSVLFLSFNQFSGEIPASIGLLPSLTDLRVFNNNLTGVLPPELGKNSPLWNLELDDNMISGELPANLCAGGDFTAISASNNSLSGSISPLAECPYLNNVQIQNNRFSGEVPIRFWKTPNLTTVTMEDNLLSGELPESLPWRLTRLEIQNNRFSGAVPSSAGKLLVFTAGGNQFSGDFPADLPQGMPLLQNLDLSGNQISGEIPATIGELTSLSSLNLSWNEISGSIPASIGSLPVLTTLDLSSNRISGDIPPEIGDLKLNSFNVSSNDLSGQIPTQLENPAYDQSFLSNPSLCSTVQMNGVNTCRAGSNGSDGLSHGLLTLFVVLGVIVFVIAATFTLFVIRDLRKRRDGSDPATWKLTSFQSLNFTENSIIRGLTEDNMVGSGGAGRVYRVAVGSQAGEIVAVKKIFNVEKLELKLEHEFESEVKILSSIRHTNIVKLLCCISSSDSKLLVYEYMENGSLDKWLHAKRRGVVGPQGMIQSRPLDWSIRLQIAIGAARGLCYMHHDCLPPIMHRDVKSSNILLDFEFNAKIADFGLARMLVNSGVPETVSAVAGSYGYMAPECGYTRKVNEKVDVYSFGVVLLELTTGREAHEGGEHNSLADWAWRHFEEGHTISDAIDESIREPVYLDKIETVLKLALICTNTIPSARPTMKEVLQVLQRCEQTYQGSDIKMLTDYDQAPLLQAQRGSQKKSAVDADDKGFDCNV